MPAARLVCQQLPAGLSSDGTVSSTFARRSDGFVLEHPGAMRSATASFARLVELAWPDERARLIDAAPMPGELIVDSDDGRASQRVGRYRGREQLGAMLDRSLTRVQALLED